jgi:DNA polymerase-3 subunit gamma/tau
MYIALYRKYRPQRFSEVVGQDGVVKVLKNTLRRKKVSHAYLLSGPRGSGKTTMARLLAKALNCERLSDDAEPCDACPSCQSIARGENLDVMEIDGASNRGIDEVRELKSHVALSPFSSRYKVYIIDEVHMLTEAAFNALLKTLEEPPAHVVFTLATTAPHKVPVTIRSRCQHLPFQRISASLMVERLRQVCVSEDISVEEEALWEMARQADGSLRDALSFLEQAVALGEGDLTVEVINDLLGGGSRFELEQLVMSLRDRPISALKKFKEMLNKGLSLEKLSEGLFLLFRDLWITHEWGDAALAGLELSEEEMRFLLEEAPMWDSAFLRTAMRFCANIMPKVRMGLRDDVFLGIFLDLFSDTLKLSVAGGRETEETEDQESSLPLASASVKDATAGWQRVMERLSTDNFPLYCAMLSAEVGLALGAVIISFPDDHPFDFHAAAAARCAGQLISLCKEELNAESVELRWKGQGVALAPDLPLSPSSPAKEVSSVTPLAPTFAMPEALKDRPPREKHRLEQPDGQRQLQQILSWFDGEILLVKKTEEEEEIRGLEGGEVNVE